MEQSNYPTGSEGRDPHLWEIARKRVGFKYHLASYVIVNSFLWIVWAFSGREYSTGYNLPWPLWPMIGWGVGLAFHFLRAYVFPKSHSVEKEYEKLRRSGK